MTASFEIKFPEIPRYGYESELKALSRAAQQIADQMRFPGYIIDPQWGERAAEATSTLKEDRHVDDREVQAAGYDPYRLTNEQLQLAIDNAMEVVRKGLGPGVHAGHPETIAALLEDHLADLLEIQRERAGGAP